MESESRDFLAWARRLAALSRSQILQDVWAWWRLGFPEHGYVLEVGAGDGVHLSNSLMFERLGWDGLLVEPNPRFFEPIASRRRMPHARAAVGPAGLAEAAFLDVESFPELSRLAEGMPEDAHDRAGRRTGARRVETTVLDAKTLLERHGCPAVVDYLSLDVEGAELVFLETLDWSRVRFRCLTVEHNFSPQREALARLLEGRNYVRVEATLSGWDDWWVAEETLADPALAERRRAFAPAPGAFDRLATLADESDEPGAVETVETLRRDAVGPSPAVAWTRRAEARGQSGAAESRNAALALNAAGLSRYPDDPALLEQRARLLLAAGHAEAAAEPARRAFERAPEKPAFRMSYVTALIGRGDLATAEALLAPLLAEHPWPAVYLLLARLEAARGRADAARAAALEGLRRRPANKAVVEGLRELRDRFAENEVDR